MKDIDGRKLEVGDEILVVGSQLRHATIINISDSAVYSKFRTENAPYSRLQITKLPEKQIYKLKQ